MAEIENDRLVLGNRLRLAREHAGLSQGQAAKLLNLHRPSVSESEAGRRRVSTDELAAYARIYRVDVQWLAIGSRENSQTEARVELAARALSKLKKGDLDKVLSLLRSLRDEEAK